jgi:hypothetical protein
MTRCPIYNAAALHLPEDERPMATDATPLRFGAWANVYGIGVAADPEDPVAGATSRVARCPAGPRPEHAIRGSRAPQRAPSDSCEG